VALALPSHRGPAPAARAPEPVEPARRGRSNAV